MCMTHGLNRAMSGPGQGRSSLACPRPSYTLAWSSDHALHFNSSHHFACPDRPLAMAVNLPFWYLHSCLSMYLYFHEALLYRFRLPVCFRNYYRSERRHYLAEVAVFHRSLPSSYSSCFDCLHLECYCRLSAPVLNLISPLHFTFGLHL